MAQLGDLVSREGAAAERRARLRSERGRRARAGASSPRPRSRSSRATSAGRAKALDAARATLEAHGDRVNAAHARYLEVRRLLLIGRLDEAERALAELDPRAVPSRVADRARAGGRRDRDAAPADESCARRARLAPSARRATRGFPRWRRRSKARVAHPERARGALVANGEERLLLLEEVEALLASNALVVDACRHVVRNEGTVVSLARRPVLFALARALGEAWPDDVARDMLIARAFGSKFIDESHRARLRVEIGRLRTRASDAWPT